MDSLTEDQYLIPKLRRHEVLTEDLDAAADFIEQLLSEIGAHHSALLKIEKETRGISTAERKDYLLTVIGRCRNWAREAISG